MATFYFPAVPPTSMPSITPTTPTAAPCTYYLNQRYGRFTSPNYPSHYPNNQHCTWLIEAPPGQNIYLYFGSFALERQSYCRFDVVEVFNGNSGASPMIKRACGRQPPCGMYSSGRFLFVKFTTDFSGTDRGFSASYYALSHSVAISPTKSSGYIPSTASPNECFNFTLLDEFDRAKGYKGRVDKCDRSLPKGWYRFLGLAGKQMPDACVAPERCGTQAPGWLSGGHPTVAQGAVQRRVCFRLSTYCCLFSTSIRVRNCGAFYVYELPPTDGCNLRYCGDREQVPTPNATQVPTPTPTNVPPTSMPTITPTTTTAAPCTYYLNQQHGRFTSPNYPSNYPNNLHCTWLIEAPPGYGRLYLRFTSFALESCGNCACDVLEIYDGNITASSLIKRVCGRQSIPTMYSSGRFFFVKFSTDSSVTNRGFSAIYIAVSQSVAISPTTSSGYIPSTAPTTGCFNFTILNEFDRAKGYKGVINKCDRSLLKGWYRFLGLAGKQMPDACVAIERCGTRAPGWLSGGHPTVAQGVVQRRVCFHGSYSCCRLSTSIRVRNCGAFYVYELTPTPGCYMRYCGDREQVLTPSPNATQVPTPTPTHVPPTTMPSITPTTPTAAPCTYYLNQQYGRFTSPNYPSNYPNNLHCTWLIEAPPGYGRLYLRFTSFALESCRNCACDVLEIFDGNSTASPLIKRACGRQSPPRMFSSGRFLFVKFSTDSSVTLRGFSATYIAVSHSVSISPTTSSGYISSTVPTTVPPTTMPSITPTTPTDHECSCYQILQEPDRSHAYDYRKVQGGRPKCDDLLQTKWYRFVGLAGDRMPDECVPSYHCGTLAAGWLRGGHPTVRDGVVSRTVCYSWANNCCWRSNNILVRNCGSFVVYKLQKPPGCYYRYCGVGYTLPTPTPTQECSNYTVLSDFDRAKVYKGVVNKCDRSLPKGWYRFMGYAGLEIPDACVAKQRCGTIAPGWLSGGHPTVAQGAVQRRVCFHWSSSCCYWSTSIRVRNCGAFYVYELPPTPYCNLRYCGDGERVPPTLPPTQVTTPTPTQAYECSRFLLLHEADRSQAYDYRQVSGARPICDNSLPISWYRFLGPAGDRMPGTCVPSYHCGTHAAGWLRGGHPTVRDGMVSRTVCYHWDNNCCWRSNNIQVRNCGRFFVYKLQKPPGCQYRYCGVGYTPSTTSPTPVTTTTPPPVTTMTTTSPPSAYECRRYRILREADRSQAYDYRQVSGARPICDNTLQTGWYRFLGPAGDRMPGTCVPSYRCGTHAAGWLRGGHPTFRDGVVSRTVCYHWDNNCCWRSNSIQHQPRVQHQVMSVAAIEFSVRQIDHEHTTIEMSQVLVLSVIIHCKLVGTDFLAWREIECQARVFLHTAAVPMRQVGFEEDIRRSVMEWCREQSVITGLTTAAGGVITSKTNSDSNSRLTNVTHQELIKSSVHNYNTRYASQQNLYKPQLTSAAAIELSVRQIDHKRTTIDRSKVLVLSVITHSKPAGTDFLARREIECQARVFLHTAAVPMRQVGFEEDIRPSVMEWCREQSVITGLTTAAGGVITSK
ncbi:hypothetical protein ACROYT_G002265 [Oculina patagonica]